MSILRFIHQLTFTFWFGTILYFTFIQAPLLFKALPRETFGLVQSKLFPTYYLIGYLCGGLLLVLFPILHPMKSWGSHDGWKFTALLFMLVLALAQGLWIGPKVAQLRVERQAAEQVKDSTKVAALSQEFGKAHGISSLLNLLMILCGGTYLFLISKAPKASQILQGLF
jgi:putative copper export protein